MKISLLALIALGAVAGMEKLGGPVVETAKFPTGKDTSSHGSTDTPGTTTDPTTDPEPEAPVDPPAEEPEPQPPVDEPEEVEEQCEKNGRYTGRPTPCDGKWTDHVTIIPKPSGWTYYYYYTYY